MRRIQSQYDAEIQKLEDSIYGLRQKLSELLQKKAEELCEFRVGDKVTDRSGRIGEVVNISAGYAGSPRFNVRLYKKDGRLGQRRTLAYSFDGWEKPN
ncbi:hypothetical protein LCGC14_0369670 [marine sediment metagenome]|uniref:Uncharacterized protein n=1 Tax=marine sediment metagenome TaxID=412755 RepID=A0A0F9WDZ6_9ZZZZ